MELNSFMIHLAFQGLLLSPHPQLAIIPLECNEYIQLFSLLNYSIHVKSTVHFQEIQRDIQLFLQDFQENSTVLAWMFN